MRALITGGLGFAGRHLAHHLVRCGDDVALTSFVAEAGLEDANKVEIPKSCQVMRLDVSDAKAVDELITVLQPDVVYHLAGITYVPDAERDVHQVMNTNATGTINLLEALVARAPEARFLCISSSEVYGEPRPGGLPLTELSELRPISSYGVSKCGAELAAHKYSYRDSLHVVRIRPFPHIGPGQSEMFALSSFAKQVAAIKLGQMSPTIKVGNLEVRRDYSDVSDIVRGYREAILNGKNGEVYNLCSGESVEIGEMLQSLIRLAGVDAEIVVDPERVRDVDISDLVGSYEKAQRDFGWKPRVERDAMLDTLLAYWLEVLSA